MKDVDPVNLAMRNLPTTVISTSLEGPLDWPDATVVRGTRSMPSLGGGADGSTAAGVGTLKVRLR